MFVGDKRQETPITISIQGEAFEHVNQLGWLIVLISSDGNSKKNIQSTIGGNAHAFENDQGMEKQRNNTENEGRLILAQHDTHFVLWSRMLIHRAHLNSKWENWLYKLVGYRIGRNFKTTED